MYSRNKHVQHHKMLHVFRVVECIHHCSPCTYVYMTLVRCALIKEHEVLVKALPHRFHKIILLQLKVSSDLNIVGHEQRSPDLFIRIFIGNNRDDYKPMLMHAIGKIRTESTVISSSFIVIVVKQVFVLVCRFVYRRLSSMELSASAKMRIALDVVIELHTLCGG